MRIIFATILSLISCSATYPSEENNLLDCDSGKCNEEKADNPPQQYGGGYACVPEIEFVINNQSYYQPAVCPMPHMNSKPEPDPDPLKNQLFDETIENTYY